MPPRTCSSTSRWIDNPAAVLHAPVLQELHHARLDVDLEPAGLHAVGEGEGILLGDEVPRLHQLARQVGRQRVAAEVDDARQLGQRHARLARLLVDDLAVDEVERVGRRLQHGAGHLQRGVLDRQARLQRRLAADAGAAAGPGAAAVGRGQRVAGDDAHLLDGHADGLGHDLAHDGLGALALLGDAGCRHHRAVGVDAHACSRPAPRCAPRRCRT